MGNTNEENVKSPKGFYMKYEWYELFETMKPKQFHNVMMNSYNYLLGNELFKMNQSESQVFMFIIKPVLEYNKKVYQDKCTHNAKISRKGVEAKAEKKLMESTNKTQINPLGNTTNPELPKDKVISKEKDISKDEFKLNVKSENKVEDAVQVESSKIDEDFIILDSFKELVKIDISKLEDNEDFQYVNNCRILAQDAGWFGFFQLIFNSSIKELPELIKIHKSSLDEYSLLEIRKHRNFYIKKLLNK
jgi:hypothetical protein